MWWSSILLEKEVLSSKHGNIFKVVKPGKASGPDSICPELLIHAGPGLEVLGTWLPFFLLAPTQNSKSMVKSAGIRDPLAFKTRREPAELLSSLSALRPLQNSRTTDLQW